MLYSHGGFGGQPAQHSQRRFINTVDSYLGLLESVRAHQTALPTQSAGLCFHSLRAVTPEQVRQVLACDTTTCPIHIHIAEQQQEVDDCLAWSGCRPLQWLLEHAPVGARWCLVHATHATLEEVTAMARSQAVVGLCPSTEANLGDDTTCTALSGLQVVFLNLLLAEAGQHSYAQKSTRPGISPRPCAFRGQTASAH